MLKKIKYYFWVSSRRKLLDKLQVQNVSEYEGVVLDIGGRDRGSFKKPKDKVEKWIFADIEAKHNPDIVLDVSEMSQIEDGSIDVLSAMELFEHVAKVNNAIAECYRVLKQNGKIIISVPFLYPVHADPSDFQRWTLFKWEKELNSAGFVIVKKEIMGRFFSVLNGMQKVLARSLPKGFKYIAYLLFPFFNALEKLDNTNWVKKHPRLGNYHGGYFIIAKKLLHTK